MNDLSSPAASAQAISELPTPALILDRTRLERNAERMRTRIAELGVELRPHVKTSKSLDVLTVLAGRAGGPITVSTLAEARYFFERGVDDILYAVGIAPVKLPQVAELITAGCKLRVVLDTVEAARAVRSFGASNGLTIETLIEIDSDGRRAGVAADDPLLLDIAAALGQPGARLAGVMTHAGGSYGCLERGEFEAMAEQERVAVVTAADRLRASGFDCAIVSVGSTPTVHYARHLDAVTEARVGVYAFGDLVQAQLGTCSVDDIAIGVLASVIGHNRSRGRLLIDAGFLALSRDRGTADLPVDWGYGAVCDPIGWQPIDDLIVSATNQEHGIVTARCGELDLTRFPVGRQLLILPNHSCATAAAYDRYFVTEGSARIVGVWDRVNGW